MSTLTELDQKIAALAVDIDLAEKADAAASLALASAPNDDAAIRKARAASLHLADLRGDSRLLNNARAHAEEADRSEEVQARKLDAVAALRSVEALTPNCIKAGEAVDAALANLSEAVREWAKAAEETKDAMGEFYRLAVPSQFNVWDMHIVRTTLKRAINNTIACQLEEALRPLEVAQSLSFNFVRNDPYSPELASRDTERALNGLLGSMNNMAKDRGLPL